MANKNPHFFTVLTKDFFTVNYKGVALFTVVPLEQAEPCKQVLINYHTAQQHIDALKAGKCRIPQAQEKYNELNKQF